MTHGTTFVNPREVAETIEHALRAKTETSAFVDIVYALGDEREFQDQKFGTKGHTFGDWVLLIESELAEAKLALIKGGTGRNTIRSELVQIAALCVAALEQHGLKGDGNGEREL